MHLERKPPEILEDPQRHVGLGFFLRRHFFQKTHCQTPAQMESSANWNHDHPEGGERPYRCGPSRGVHLTATLASTTRRLNGRDPHAQSRHYHLASGQPGAHCHLAAAPRASPAENLTAAFGCAWPPLSRSAPCCLACSSSLSMVSGAGPVPATVTCSSPSRLTAMVLDVLLTAVVDDSIPLRGRRRAHGCVIPQGSAMPSCGLRHGAGGGRARAPDSARYGDARLPRPGPDARGAPPSVPESPAALSRGDPGPRRRRASSTEARHLEGRGRNKSTVTGSIAEPNTPMGGEGPAPSPRSIGCSCAWLWRAWEGPAAPVVLWDGDRRYLRRPRPVGFRITVKSRRALLWACWDAASRFGDLYGRAGRESR